MLVLSADVGESHAVMAKALVDELQARTDVASVVWVNDFTSLGPLLGRLLPSGFRFHLGRVQWSYDLAYRLFTQLAVARRFGEWMLYRLGATAILALVADHAPEVVISVYPVMNPVLARLRAAGRLPCPVAAVVGPLGGLRFWVQPHADLHLALYPEAIPEIERLAGPGRTRAVRPLVREEFFSPISRAQARACLGLAPEARVVLVSGGGWGAGDLTGALEAALRIDAVELIAVTGRNEALRSELADRYAAEPRVTVTGFTERMRDLLCAADAFVTATAGLSAIESRLCGCPTVCYGFAIGHVRDNVAALSRDGLSRTAATPEELERELRQALSGERPPIPALTELPRTAELVAELGRASAYTAASRSSAR